MMVKNIVILIVLVLIFTPQVESHEPGEGCDCPFYKEVLEDYEEIKDHKRGLNGWVKIEWKDKNISDERKQGIMDEIVERHINYTGSFNRNMFNFFRGLIKDRVNQHERELRRENAKRRRKGIDTFRSYKEMKERLRFEESIPVLERDWLQSIKVLEELAEEPENWSNIIEHIEEEGFQKYGKEETYEGFVELHDELVEKIINHEGKEIMEKIRETSRNITLMGVATIALRGLSIIGGGF